MFNHQEDDQLEKLYGRDVRTFVTAMELKLRMYQHRGHWSNTSIDDLLDRLSQEIHELKEAIGSGSRDQVMLEAADVANFVMMIATNFGRKDD